MRALVLTTLVAVLGAVAPAPATAQRAGPGPAPGPWQQAYPDLFYNYGGIRLPFAVPGGSKGPGTINAAGLYLNGVSITSVPVAAANMPAFSGDCSSAAGTTTLTCTRTQGTLFAPSATTDTTNAGNINSGTLPPARLPAPGAATRGGVLAASAPANQFQAGIDTTGAPIFAQPAFANLSGVLLATQVPAFTGDFTCSGLTCSLATVNAAPGSYGGAASIPTFTVNGKGLLTTTGSAAVAAPAGTLTGTTLAANVVNTSITKVGTIATGVWNGTAIDPAFIATGTSGATIGLLNTNKIDSGSNTYSGSNSFTGANTHSSAGSETFNGPTTFAAGVSETHNGPETHGGAETHTGTVTVPTPTAPGHAATKGYVDTAVNGVMGGSRVLLATLTASNSATLSDTTHFTASYTEYEIVFENVVPATTNNTISLQAYIGGTLQTSSYTNSIYAGANGGASTTTNAGIQLTFASGINNAAPGLNGTLRVSNATQTTAPKMFVGTMGYPPAGIIMTMGYYNASNGALTGIQAVASSGNIASGVIKIYGWN